MRIIGLLPFRIAIALMVVCLLTAPTFSLAAAGYTARACGFDMNDDGVMGDTSGAGNLPDCAVCDGVTTDVDGDGQDEDLIYVDCESGLDTNSGTPASPYKTINKALSVNDGNGDGREDIICVRGTCSQWNGSLLSDGTYPGASISLTSQDSGITASVQRNANSRTEAGGALWTNTENLNQRYATAPTMIVGWDTDGDGQYPPYDTNQPKPFVIDGCDTNPGASACAQSTIHRLFDLGQADYVELAHMSIRNVGITASGGYGQWVVRHGDAGSTSEYHYLHDIEFDYNLILSSAGEGGAIRFNTIGGNNAAIKYYSIENCRISRTGQWPIRGWTSGSSGPGDYIRALRNSFVDNAVPATWWSGYNSEFADNKIWYTTLMDSNPWGARSENGIRVYPTDNLYITGNEIIDIPSAIWLPLHLSASGQNGWQNAFVARNYIHFTRTPAWFTRVLGIGANKAHNEGLERNECSVCAATLAEAPHKTCFTKGAVVGGNDDCECDNRNWATSYMRNLRITDNVLDYRGVDPAKHSTAIHVKMGNNCSNVAAADQGPVIIANNSILGWSPTSASNCTTTTAWCIPRAAISTRQENSSDDWDVRFQNGAFKIANNLITGMNGDIAIINAKRGASGIGPGILLTDPISSYSGADFTADNNYYGGTSIRWTKGAADYTSLSSWRSATGDETSSKLSTDCTPSLEADGIHIKSDDTCLLDAGNSDEVYSTVDFDGDPRSIGGQRDIGADEFVTTANPGVISLASGVYQMTENGPVVQVSAVRTGGSDGPAQANWATVAGTASGGATCTGEASVDYINANGQVSWGAGESGPRSFNLTPCDDSTDEPEESFTVALSAITGATGGSPSSATVIIADDDEAPTSAPFVDNAAGTKTGCNTGLGEALTIPNVTVNGGQAYTNRILLVAVGAYSSSTNNVPWCKLTDPEVSVTWNGHAMALAGDAVGYMTNAPAGSWMVCSGIFYLLSPPQGTGDVVIDLNVDTGAGQYITQLTGATLSVYQAQQAAPSIATWGSPWGGVETPLSTDFNATTGSMMLVDSAVLSEVLGGGNVLAGGGQVERADVSCRYDIAGTQLAVSTKEVTVPAVYPMSWSWLSGNLRRQAHVIAGIKADTIVVPPDTTTTTTTSTTTTVTVPNCGNNQVDPPEQCDGPDLNGKKCSNFAPWVHGSLACTPDCTFDLSGCTANRRGRDSDGRATSWCETTLSPTCGGTCPRGQFCVDTGSSCACQ